MNAKCHGCNHTFSWHWPPDHDTGLESCIHGTCKCPQFHTEADIITDEQTKAYTRHDRKTTS